MTETTETINRDKLELEGWPGNALTKPRDFNAKRWAREALLSQTASNTGALLRSALNCLQEWRDAGGDWSGKVCVPFKFMIFQVGFLCGNDPGGVNYGDSPDYRLHTDLLMKIGLCDSNGMERESA